MSDKKDQSGVLKPKRLRKPKAINGQMIKIRKRHRDNLFTPEVIDSICDLISQGLSIYSIAKLPNYPSASAICLRVTNDERFAEKYTRARIAQATLLADQIIDLADDRSFDVSGELEIPNGVAVQRSRLMVDTRKWYLSKVLPKVFGDKLSVEQDTQIRIVVEGIGEQKEHKALMDNVINVTKDN